MMRRTLGIAVLLVIPFTASCSTCNVSPYDVLFGAFGRYYSGGGPSLVEKKYDYDQQVERWQQASLDHAR